MSYTKLGFESGQVLEAEHLNHMESGIESADITGADGVIKQEHLPEGYPYKTFEEGYILEECQPMYSTQMSALVVNESLHYVEVGKEYTVTWNGTEYNCVVKIITSAPEEFAHFIGLPAMGNFAVVGGENTGEPFAILCVPEESVRIYGFAYGVIPLDGSTQITLSIRGDVPVYHPISEKYLPLTNMVIKAVREVGKYDIVSADKTFLEIHTAVMSGVTVSLFITENGNPESCLVAHVVGVSNETIIFSWNAGEMKAYWVIHTDNTWTRM